MKTTAHLLCLAGLVSAATLADGPVVTPPQAKTNLRPAQDFRSQPKVVAVIITSVGRQRARIDPVMLYTTELGWRFRLKRFAPKEAERVQGEKCSPGVLDQILASARSTTAWAEPGRYGNTELTFCRSDGKMQAIVFEKEATSEIFKAVEPRLPTKSPIWTYVAMINRDFPPAPEGVIPPDLIVPNGNQSQDNK